MEPRPSTSSDLSLSNGKDSPLVPMENANGDINGASVGAAKMLDVQNIGQDPDQVQRQRAAAANPFQVDTSLIHAIPANEQAAELQQLGLQVFNQEEFEQGVMNQVDSAMAVAEKERMERILQKELKTVEEDIRPCKQELQNMEKVIQLLTPQAATNKEINRRLLSVKQKKEIKAKQLKKLKAKQKSLALKLGGGFEELDGDDDQMEDGSESMLEQALLGLGTSAKETETERMIRLGEMTPFGTTVAASQLRPPVVTDFEQYLLDQDNKSAKKTKVVKKPTSSIARSIAEFNSNSSDQSGEQKKKKTKKRSQMRKSLSESSLGQKDQFEAKSQKLKFNKGAGFNYFDAKDHRTYKTESDYSKSSARKRKLYYPKLRHNFSEDRALSDVEVGDEMNEEPWGEDDQQYLPPSDEDFDPNSDVISKKKSKHATVAWDESYSVDSEDVKSKSKKKGRRNTTENVHFTRTRDDGSAEYYQKRLKQWHKAELARKHEKMKNGEPDTDEDSDMEFDGGYRVPARIWNKLYRYQKTGVKWLWELHCQQAGGILGDEMGLGKTIQIIAFLTGLRHSKLSDRIEATRHQGLGPSIIVCPATIIHQWVREFHTWWPAFRVGVLHNSGSYTSTEDSLVYNIYRSNGILIMPYSSTVIYQDILLPYNWHYVILDEGHKIRNPDAQCTIACKQFRTHHRIILSGSPVQNNLKELWSLFDFVFPGKLGTLPDFMAHFSVPIVQGGYSNATEVQVQTAYKCACVLRDTINPYLLRRMKADVQNNLSLPSKNEQVLFCRLTDHQRDVYQEYIGSKECQQIITGNFMVFPGLITLRKICNHPDLSTGGPRVFNGESRDDDETLEYGYWRRSGKLIVVESLLKLWKKQDHRVLLFSQSKQMLDIFEDFVNKRQYTYLRMDGGTTIASRQPLITQFNEDPSIYIFLLTTRVGGLGVNLTGADRVVIFDPDWNPSTDTQARERAWRIGQTRPVTVYRLLTTGSIEEKIYHRQIFKQFLTNRVLKDPKQRRFFKSNDLYELFTLGDDNPQDGTETSAIFAGTGSDVRVTLKSKKSKGKVNRFDRLKEIAEKEKLNMEMGDSDDEMAAAAASASASAAEEAGAGEGTKAASGTDSHKLTKMKELAKLLSKRIAASKSQDEKMGSGEQAEAENSIGETEVTLQSEMQNGCDSRVDNSEASSASKKKSKKKHRRDKDKKKKRKHRDAALDGEKIEFLDKHSVYKPEREEKEGDNSKAGDDYVLQRLFKKTGVHSALQHDKIMMSSNPDYALVEGEAERVAAEAARALKQSRSRCLGAAPGVPTWTGHSGHAGAPPKPRFGMKKKSGLGQSPIAAAQKIKEPYTDKPKEDDGQPKASHFDGTFAGSVRMKRTVKDADAMSSSELLSRMRSRNHLILQANQMDENEDRSTCEEPEPEHIDLITDIRNYIAFGARVDGQATTQELLDQFGKQVPANSTAEFKAMLKQLCDLHRVGDVGTWKLKPAFR